MSNEPAILVIDDDQMLVNLVEHKLRKRGYQVTTASDGKTGLQRARELLPDLIVLDIMMPGLDGRQVLHELRLDPALVYIPVIMLTARRRESDVVDALELGASDFVSKPFSPEELAARVARLVPKNGAARQ